MESPGTSSILSETEHLTDGLARPATPFLGLVSARIERAIGGQQHAHSVVLAAARDLAFAPDAKRARPMLVETLAAVTGAERWAAVDFAAAVELIHTASLLHDDVIDGASDRRGRPTANALHGNAVAVLAGDFVLTAALKVLRPWGERAVSRAIEVIGEMTGGVATEVLARRDPDFDVPTWREMAERKTGALFGLAAWLVAWPDDRADRFDKALRHLGVAFQVADDAAEIAANVRAPYPPSQDLATGNPSFLVAFALQGEAAAEDISLKTDLAAFWRAGPATDDAVRKAAVSIVALGGLAAARRTIAIEVAAARQAFGKDVDEPAIKVVLRWADTLIAF